MDVSKLYILNYKNTTNEACIWRQENSTRNILITRQCISRILVRTASSIQELEALIYDDANPIRVRVLRTKTERNETLRTHAQ